MDRQKCKLITEAVEEAIRAAGIEEKFGVKASYGGGNYSPASTILKFKFEELASDGSNKAAQEDWKLAVLMGMPEDGLGKEFAFRGQRFKVVGFKSRAKYNVCAERLPDGKIFRFEARTPFPDCEAAKRRQLFLPRFDY